MINNFSFASELTYNFRLSNQQLNNYEKSNFYYGLVNVSISY